MAKRRVKLPKLQEKKIKTIIFFQPITRFYNNLLTKNLEASKREATFLQMQFGECNINYMAENSFTNMKVSEKSNLLKLGQTNINISHINK